VDDYRVEVVRMPPMMPTVLGDLGTACQPSSVGQGRGGVAPSAGVELVEQEGL
jgi:hypothetical protein